MHSSWQVWDFFNHHPKVLQHGIQGIYAWYCFDPYISKLVKDSIDKSITITTVMGNEVNTSWLEDNFLSLNLFGNNESFLIQNAQMLSKECQKIIQDSELLLDNRYLILSFSEQSTFFKKIITQENVLSYEILAPKFWDYQKLLEFFADKFRVRLSYQVKQIILDRVNNTCANFINILKSLQINFCQNEISLEMLNDVLVSERLDKFELATTFCLKKIDQFYKRILESSVGHETLRDLFFFMQGHLMKVYDTSFLDQKSKLSQYDKKVLGFSKSWNRQELEQQIDHFRKLEQMAKVKSIHLMNEIRSQYLTSLAG